MTTPSIGRQMSLDNFARISKEHAKAVWAIRRFAKRHGLFEKDIVKLLLDVKMLGLEFYNKEGKKKTYIG